VHRSPVITLTTDFGLADPYVAAMKGVILSLNPAATIVDITHEVRPQQVAQAAFLLSQALPYFPLGTIHVVVVDPGVGTARQALVLVTPEMLLLGPDNGVLSAALPEETRRRALLGPDPRGVELPEGYRAVALRRRRYMRKPVSATFHGRDVFAPAAAHLSLGVGLEALGPAVRRIRALPPFRARRRPDGTLEGRVMHVDRFGNVVTDVRAEDLPAGRIEVSIGGQHIEGLASTYEDGPDLKALVGSAGYLEVACRGGSAAYRLGVDVGASVLVAERPA
jgi:S-adenosyl-L-methionine hydrolase (adenosine-forming)